MISSALTENILEIRIPRETVNDDHVTLVRWHRQTGAEIKRGETVVSIETSKAVLDLESPASGYLEILVPEGMEVSIGELIGRITPAAKSSAPSEIFGSRPDEAETSSSCGLGTRFSGKAQSLMKRHGIPAAAFAELKMVRERDVQDYLESSGEPSAQTSPVNWEPHTNPSGNSGGLFHDARVSAEERGCGILWLMCNYFFRNYLLGNLVRIAPRGVILWLHRLRGVKMGKGCFIDPTAIIETAYPEKITLGDDVRIAARAVIMAHIKGPHHLRQTGLVPNVLKPVVLEDHCFIGVNAVILPGVRVGTGAVVASGAVVVSDVPAYTLAAGNPAKTIKRFRVESQ